MRGASTTFPPGPRSALRAYIALRRDPLGFLTRAAQRYGDVVHLKVGGRHDYLLNRPEHIRDVLLAPEGMLRSSARPLRKVLGLGLLTTTGDPHRAQRRLMQPLFGRQQLAPASAVIVEKALRVREDWRAGTTVDIADAMASLAQRVMVRLLVKLDDAEEDRLTRLLSEIVDGVNRNTFPSLLELLFGIPRRSARALDRAVALMDRKLYDLITARRASGRDHGDLLSAMLRVRDDRSPTGGMSDTQIRDELLTFVSAGHETIGNALTWTWYLLARHPEWEAEMHVEIDATLGTRDAAAEDIPRLGMTEAILRESMRLYPPVWVVARRPVNDWLLGEFLVPAGSYFQVCPYVTHRDPRNYEAPEVFNPRRWLDGDGATPGRMTYFPFAAGVHKCIGEGLAWSEGILVLATLAQQWRLRLAEPDRRPEPEALITLRPRGGMPMVVEERGRRS